jgi:hypothetical protein
MGEREKDFEMQTTKQQQAAAKMKREKYFTGAEFLMH